MMFACDISVFSSFCPRFSAQGLKVKNAEAVFRLLDEDRSNGISKLLHMGAWER